MKNLILSSITLATLALSSVAVVACGGGGDDPAAAGTAGSAGTGAAASADGKACNGPADCPAGFGCTTKTLAAPKSPAPCTKNFCDTACGGDPACVAECLKQDCGGGVPSGSPACDSLCASVGSKCGSAAGLECQASCPTMSATCVACVAAGDVCAPESCLATAACGGGGPSGAGGGTGGGGSPAASMVCKALPTGTGGSTGAAGSAGTAGAPAAAMTWAGTWIATLQYDVECTAGGSGAKHYGSNSHTVTVDISGANSKLTATPADGYAMTGVGTDTSLTLTGQFPLRNDKGDTAKASSLDGNNEVTIKIDSVSGPKQASGTLGGQFPGNFTMCVPKNGKVTLSR